MELLGNNQQIPSILKDPFVADRLQTIRIRFYIWENAWTGSIDFKNGSTEGTQSFKVNGVGSLPELVKQMDEFIKSLK